MFGWWWSCITMQGNFPLLFMAENLLQSSFSRVFRAVFYYFFSKLGDRDDFVDWYASEKGLCILSKKLNILSGIRL